MAKSIPECANEASSGAIEDFICDGTVAEMIAVIVNHGPKRAKRSCRDASEAQSASGASNLMVQAPC